MFRNCSAEIQNTVNRTWRQFVCGAPGNRRGGDIGDPLICDGLQYGITSHWYRAENDTGAVSSDPQVRFLVVNQYKRWIDDVAAETRRFAAGRAFRNRPRSLVVLSPLFLLWSGRKTFDFR